MTEKDQVRKQLQEQLDEVNKRLRVLDMMEEKLFQMKALAQKAIDENLADEETQEINKQVKDLEEQVRLLDSGPTQLS